MHEIATCVCHSFAPNFGAKIAPLFDKFVIVWFSKALATEATLAPFTQNGPADCYMTFICNRIIRLSVRTFPRNSH